LLVWSLKLGRAADVIGASFAELLLEIDVSC
jgi:hypothetical protein